MRNEWNIWVVGGDLRQVRLAQLLDEEGHTVHTWALEEAEGVPGPAPDLEGARLADCVVLPLPAAGEDGGLNAPFSRVRAALPAVLDALRPGQVVCAGRVSPELAEEARARGLRLFDYFGREEMAVANAVPTALAMGHLPPESFPAPLHILGTWAGRPGRQSGPQGGEFLCWRRDFGPRCCGRCWRPD